MYNPTTNSGSNTIIQYTHHKMPGNLTPHSHQICILATLLLRCRYACILTWGLPVRITQGFKLYSLANVIITTTTSTTTSSTSTTNHLNASDQRMLATNPDPSFSLEGSLPRLGLGPRGGRFSLDRSLLSPDEPLPLGGRLFSRGGLGRSEGAGRSFAGDFSAGKTRSSKTHHSHT